MFGTVATCSSGRKIQLYMYVDEMIRQQLKQSFQATKEENKRMTRKRIFLSTIVPGSVHFQLPDLAGFGYALGVGFWVEFTIIVSLTRTLTTTLTIILT